MGGFGLLPDPSPVRDVTPGIHGRGPVSLPRRPCPHVLRPDRSVHPSRVRVVVASGHMGLRGRPSTSRVGDTETGSLP